MGDHALVGVVLGIEDQGLEGLIGAALGLRDAFGDSGEDLGCAHPLLRAGKDDFVEIEADNAFELAGDALRFGVREVNLVEDGDELEVLVHRQVNVREGLRFDALGGVNDEDGAFAGGEGTRNFVREVHVARGIDEVVFVLDAIGGRVRHPGGGRLDGDPLLAFQVHRVEQLLGHIALTHRAGRFEEAVSEG